jgi:hypothetical protein
MANKSPEIKEPVIKEYPNVSIWLVANMAQGYGNLVLTSERLMFLNQVALEEWQLKKAQQLSREGDFNKVVEFTMKLHKNNFQIPLSSVTKVKMGLFSLIPMPRLCMRIHYLTKKDKPAETSFAFRIPLLKGLVELELTLIMAWISAVKAAVKAKQQARAT